MRTSHPNIISMTPEWQQSLRENLRGLKSGRYVPARPLGYPSFSQRVKAAWLVFTGKADALIWPGGQ